MTDNRVIARAIGRATSTALLIAGLSLAACSPNNPVSGSSARVYAADLTGGAKVCTVPTITPAPGKTTDIPIKLRNDGGWCGIQLHQPGPKPFEAGLLTARPGHGDVLIHQVGDETRIDYTPDRSFSGSDNFEVKLIPGDAALRVSVLVAAPQT